MVAGPRATCSFNRMAKGAFTAKVALNSEWREGRNWQILVNGGTLYRTCTQSGLDGLGLMRKNKRAGVARL